MSKTILGVFLAVETLLVMILAGCGATFDYEGLRRLDPAGDDFAGRLSREYKVFALFEADRMYDWPDAARFGGKAIRAAAGDAPPPERLRDWWLPAETVGEISGARARLMAVLERGARERLPAAAARAQARFDCWLEQQEENWQTDHIARCRDGLQEALAEIEGYLRIGVANTPAQAAGYAPGLADGAAEPESFVLLFDFDSAGIRRADAETLDAVARASRGGASVRIVLAGHADRAGTEAYNRDLSRRRAQAVREALIARRVNLDRISAVAYGEGRPRVPTPDGARHPRNRRVEVSIGAQPAL